MKAKKAKTDRNAIAETHGISDEKWRADLCISPLFMSASITEVFSKELVPDVKIIDLSVALRDNIKEVNGGEMASIEAMLVGQAQALQAIFVNLGIKAAGQTNLKHYNTFMTMALKAQTQSRSTLQALTELKYPRQATFVKQANISQGHQQINNVSENSHAHARDIQHMNNELLSENNNETMDTRRAAKTSGTDKAMATLEK